MKSGIKKLAHNFLAMAVSVCMVCTLTPSAAWATSGSSNQGDFAAAGDGTASASSKVTASVRDANFAFEITAGANYVDVDKFIDALKNGDLKLEATMPKEGIPDNYTVAWYVQEVQENKDFDSTKDEGPDNKKTKLVGDATKLSEATYTNGNAPTTNNVPTFTYPSADGMIYSPDQLTQLPNTEKGNNNSLAKDKLYEFSIVMINNDNNDDASARTLITFMPDYNPQTLHGIPTETAGDFVAQGDFYTSFSIPLTFPQFSVTAESESSGDYTALQNAAADNDEEIVSANQLAITYSGNAPNLPEGQAPYLSSEAGNGLSVSIPLPEGMDPAVGSTDVKVYGLTQTKGETSSSVKTYPSKVVELEREDGSKYKAVEILVQDTGAKLGSFAIATPMTEFYTAYVEATDGGIISPGGNDGVVSGCSLVKAKEFTALALSPGFAFSGFEVSINGGSLATSSLDISGNVLRFDPTKHGIKNGDQVSITAKFSKVEVPTDLKDATAYNVIASLEGKDGATGTMTIAPAQAYSGAPASKSLGVGESTTYGRVNDYAGLFLQFAPETPDCVIDYVRVNDGDLKFEYSSQEVMIGALTGDTNIEVGYRKLAEGETPPSAGPKVNVKGVIDKKDWPAGYIRAMLVIDGVPSQTKFSNDYETNFGGSQTIQLRHTTNYRVQATQIDSNGVETDVTSKMVTGETLDSITVYNVTHDVQIQFKYIPKEAELGGTTGPGGSGTIVIDPTQQPNSVNAQSKAKMRTMSARAASDNENKNIIGANQALEEGNRARIFATPAPGYELGRVEINGTNVTEYFMPHYADGSVSQLTMTVYRTETGSIPPDAGKWLLEGWEFLGLYDNVTDNVVPIEGNIATLTMTFNPKVPTSSAYQTITTQVDGVGGTITPSLKVEQNTTATIEFFPDDTYRVASYTIDGVEKTFTDPSPASSLKCEVPVGTKDHTVTVRFAPGSTQNMPETYTITPMVMNAGGTVSPSQPVKVHKMGANDSFNFSILPKTGYRLAATPTVEPADAATLDRNGYTCTITNVKADCNIVITFASDDASSNDPTHVVRAHGVDGDDDWTSGYVAKGGTVKPASPFTVADGADASFTFLPNAGYYVKGVYVVGSTTPTTPGADDDIVTKKDRGINLVGSVQDSRMFTLHDVRSDTILEVVFGNLDDDFGDGDSEDKEAHTPPALNDGTFTLSPGTNAEIGEGATISPDLNDLEFVAVKESDGTVHAAAGSDITIIISSGYELDGNADNGGITVKNKDKNGNEVDVTGNITVKPAGDGLYEVKIPAKNVTPDMKLIVNTKPDDATQGVINTASVKVTPNGNGTISPAGINGVVRVESGKSQTFSFIPESGWKLFRVYVNKEVVNVTGNAFTMHNITGDTNTVEAVFVEGEQQPPVTQRIVNVINSDSTGERGSVTPTGAIPVVDNAALSILVEPEAGYQAVAYEGTSRAAGKEIPIAGNTIELANITSNRTITVYFDPIGNADLVSLAVSYGAGGSVSPSGNMLIAKGKTQTLSILPDAGKAVKSLKLAVDGNVVPNQKPTTTADGKGIVYTTPAADKKMLVEIEFCNGNDADRIKDLPTGDDLRKPSGKDTYHDLTAFVGGGGGTVTPTYAKVANGASITYTFVALDGYHFASATLDGTPINANSITNNGTTFQLSNVQAAHEIVVMFDKDKSGNADLEKYYTVFASSNGNGTISPAGPVTVAGGGSQSFTIMPEPNYKVQNIVITNTSNNATTTVKGDDFKGSSYTLFSVSNDMNFVVTFTKVENGEAAPPTFMTHSINASASLNGSISPAGTRIVDHGGDAMFTFVPWDGYKLSYVIVDGANIPAKAITNMQYTFPKVTEKHTIHAVFIGENEKAADFATLNVTCGSNGTVSPSGSLLVEVGASTTIDVTPFLRYKVGDIKIGSASDDNPPSLGLSDYTNVQKSGTVNVGGKQVGYRWGNGQLRLTNIQDQTFVNVAFVQDPSSPANPGDTVPNYEKISTDVTGGGTTSIQPNPIYVQEPPADLTSDDPDYWDKTTMDVSIVPEDGKIAKEITITYGGTPPNYTDGGKMVITKDGTEVYDKDGQLIGTDDSPTLKSVYEDGFITVDTNRGSVDIKVTYDDKAKVPGADSYNPPTFFDVNVTYSAGGTVGPAASPLKVAKGSRLTLQMIPNANYDIATVTVNGTNKTSEVFPETRTFVLDVQANTNVNVAFGYVKPDDESGDKNKTHMVTAEVISEEGSGTISPMSDEVPHGSSETIYFAPAAGYKISTVRVTRDGKTETYDNSDANSPAFNSPSMAIRNIISDVNVQVEYVKAAPGEQTWTVKTVPLTVEVGAGLGSVSPTYSEPIVGSATEVKFYPQDEWTASYYTLNGKTYMLPPNVSSVPITPDPSAGDDGNVMKVFFEHYGNDVDQVVNVKLVDSGDGQYHGAAAPSQATVSYGGSTTFYIYPEISATTNKGYTVDYVRFNGVDQKVTPEEGVISSDYSNKATTTVTNGTFPSTPTSSKVTGSDVDRLTSANNTYYNAYKVTLDNVVTSGTLEVKFKPIPNGTANIVTTALNKMTITSEGGGMVSPLGEVVVPEGQTVDILTTTFESYYLYSVIRTDSKTGDVEDLTANVQGRVVRATMGANDCTVNVTFKRVNQQPEADVHVSLKKATYNDRDITADVQVGSYYDPSTEKLVALKLNEKGELCDTTTNEPISYVRGGSYEFYFDPQIKGDNGRDLVLSSATYAGQSQSVIPGANYLSNVVVNASGGFVLEFRELEEGEQPLNPAKGYSIYVYAHNDDGTDGIVTPPGPFTRQAGGSVTIAFSSESNDDTVSVSFIYLQCNDDSGSPMPPIDVSPMDYANGTYTLSDIDRDYEIHVVFQRYSIVRVDWDNSLGFVTPNHAPGSYIYRPTDMATLDFLVAPYQDCELVGVYSGPSDNSLTPLVVSDDEKYEKNLKDKLGIADPEEEGGITTMDLTKLPEVQVEPMSYDFAKVFGVTADLEKGGNTYLSAQFRDTRVNQPHTIKASVKNGHGTVSPSGDVEVPYGATQTFTASPEAGYTVVGLVVDGNRVPAASTYTFTNVIADHTIEFEFGLPLVSGGGGSGADRLLRVASSLAQTGDLTGPVIGMFLVIAAAGLVVTGVSYIRRQQRRRRRREAMGVQ